MGISVPEIYDILELEGNTYVLEEKMPGTPLNKINNANNHFFVNNIKIEHIKKFILDFYKIMSEGYATDMSNLGNYMYDDEHGFSFIDTIGTTHLTPDDMVGRIVRILMLDLRTYVSSWNRDKASEEENKALNRVLTALTEISIENPNSFIDPTFIQQYFEYINQNNKYDLDLSKIMSEISIRTFRKDLLDFEKDNWIHRRVENTTKNLVTNCTSPLDIIYKLGHLDSVAYYQNLDFEVERKNIEFLLGRIIQVYFESDIEKRNIELQEVIQECKKLKLNFSDLVSVAKSIVISSKKNDIPIDLLSKIFNINSEILISAFEKFEIGKSKELDVLQL